MAIDRYYGEDRHRFEPQDSPFLMSEVIHDQLMRDLGEMEYTAILEIAIARAMGRVYSAAVADVTDQAVLTSLRKRAAAQVLSRDEMTEYSAFLGEVRQIYKEQLTGSLQDAFARYRRQFDNADPRRHERGTLGDVLEGVTFGLLKWRD